MTRDTTTAEHIEKIMRQATPESRQIDRSDDGDFVMSSWQRCLRDYSIDPSVRPRIPVVESRLVRDYEDELEELSTIAGEEMHNLHRAIQGSGYATILASRDGVILRSICDSGLDEVFSQSNLRVGGNWSEQNAGTNGVGTCIQENRPVTIHRDQHFLACNINLSCTGAPIHNPFGELVAVLDASSVIGDNSMTSQMLVRGLVSTTVRSIENQLIKVSAGRQRVIRFHSHMQFLGLQHEALICINDDDIIVAANEVAALLFSQNSVARCLGKHITHFFESESGIPVSDGLLKKGCVLPLRLRNGGQGRVYATLCELPNRRLINHSEPVPSRGVSVDQGSLGLDAVAGNDERMHAVVRTARRLMDKNIALLLHGETGTGKDVFARAIHEASERSEKPFVAINCAAIPESLIESELYGYRSGAFTGAKREGMKGKIEQSDGGTLFLDEIGDMPVALQTRLLRCVEEGAVVPLGGDKPIPVNLHLVCATHKDLPDLIEKGQFREDLYYRLNGMCLELIPLRDRQDVSQVVRNMIAAEAGRELHIDPAAMAAMTQYPWPGNFRELRNVVRTAVALCDTQLLTVQELPRKIAEFAQFGQAVPLEPERSSLISGSYATPATSSARELLINAEKQALLRALDGNEWNITRTAEALDMSRNTLYRKLKKHDIKPD